MNKIDLNKTFLTNKPKTLDLVATHKDNSIKDTNFYDKHINYLYENAKSEIEKSGNILVEQASSNNLHEGVNWYILGEAFQSINFNLTLVALFLASILNAFYSNLFIVESKVIHLIPFIKVVVSFWSGNPPQGGTPNATPGPASRPVNTPYVVSSNQGVIVTDEDIKLTGSLGLEKLAFHRRTHSSPDTRPNFQILFRQGNLMFDAIQIHAKACVIAYVYQFPDSEACKDYILYGYEAIPGTKVFLTSMSKNIHPDY